MEMNTSLRDRFSDLRAREFPRLDATRHAYLDYTGSALYPDSLVRGHAELLRGTVLGNPHSENPASRASTERVDEARAAVLRFFDADPAEYGVCFTANATAAIKLVGEAFPFGPGSRYLLATDNHNSINGVREYAARRGADVEYLPLDAELRLIDAEDGLPAVSHDTPSLFAFPAQSNFSGVKHPLTLVAAARDRGYAVLLDAAAFAPTQPLSLRQVPADFVAVSFYKMFGYPTGVGALIARHDSLARLERPWFAGGAVEFVSASARMHLLSPGVAGFEDGTPNFLGIAVVPDGLAFLSEIGMDEIQAHVARLTERLLAGMDTLRHADGQPLVQLYGPATTLGRGGIVPFNLADRHGSLLPHDEVVEAAAASGISLRGGCFCNPGATESAFGYDPGDLRRCLESTMDGFTLERFSDCMNGAPVGAVRASLGLASNEEDVDRLVELLRQFSALDDTRSAIPAAEVA